MGFDLCLVTSIALGGGSAISWATKNQSMV